MAKNVTRNGTKSTSVLPFAAADPPVGEVVSAIAERESDEATRPPDAAPSSAGEPEAVLPRAAHDLPPAAEACRESSGIPVLIQREPEDESIHVGARGDLIVPREDFDAGLEEGVELDLAAQLPKKIRKPDRREWIALAPASEMTARLLIHKPQADAIEEEHYYVDKKLRGPIADELKVVRVFVFYSFKTKTHGLWLVKVTPENSWYESLQQLLKQPAEFFQKNAVRVISDRLNSRYRVKRKDLPSEVSWPDKPTEALLGEALGPGRFISSPDHPIYRELIEGVELT